MKDHIYTREWFMAHTALRDEYRAVAEVIHELFGNECYDCIDVGCGMGFIIERLQELAWVVSGCDGARVVKECAPALVRDWITTIDLTVKRSAIPIYDMAICTEVGEHLDPQFADALVHNVSVITLGPIFWTAALKGQGGTDHVNEQDPPYWIEKFAAHGKRVDEATTLRAQTMLRERVTGMRWFWHSMVFR